MSIHNSLQSKAKILIAEDSQAQRLMLKKILEQAGHQVIVAKDGRQAIQLFKGKQPDLIILDVIMPYMDGIEVAELVIEELGNSYIPIIFITEMSSDENLQRCLNAGADDFISKPFNEISLIAKIRSLLRVKHLLQEQYIQKRQLQEFQQKSDQEEEVAAALYKNILHAGFFETPEVKYSLSPMALFNGDVFLTAKTPGNQLYILLGDFTGHGLSASIGAGPAAEIFYGMTEKGFGIAEIIIEINRKMHRLLPVHMFFAATIATLHVDTETLNLISCGLPDHYLYNRTTKKLQTIVSDNLPLGIVDNFEPKAQILKISSDDYFYLFTDGIIEAENRLGVPFDNVGVIKTLQQKENGYTAVLSALKKHTKGLKQQDDLTFVELHCNVKNAQWMRSEEKVAHKALQALSWKSSMELHISTLRHVNPVPVVIHSIMDIQGLLEHRESIFLIVTELFANALEHGLLALDSKMKQTSDGFMQYYNIREEKLSQLQEGSITMHFNHQPTEKGGRLIIKVKDTGKGFDFESIELDLESNQQNFGRGINLLKRLCTEIKYSGNGNHVKAVYDWET